MRKYNVQIIIENETRDEHHAVMAFMQHKAKGFKIVVYDATGIMRRMPYNCFYHESENEPEVIRIEVEHNLKSYSRFINNPFTVQANEVSETEILNYDLSDPTQPCTDCD